ncbi:MAG: IclR family transcriptional regulator [Desulfatiglandaceae bacterium]
MIVKAVDRITRILKAVGESRNGLTNADLAETLDLPKSTLSKILGSLTSYDWLAMAPSSKRYQLGPLNLSMGGRYLDNLDLVRMGQRFLRKLNEETEETTAMEIPNGLEVVMVAKILAGHARIRNETISGEVERLAELGQRAPLYATAAGKCILAYRTKTEIEQYMKSVQFVPFTSNTITETERLWREIKKIREEALAYNFRELNPHTIAVAAPVFDLYKRVIAALAVITPDFNFDDNKRRHIEEATRRESAEFSKMLGYQER